MHRPSASIVVPVWNAADVTATCLELLRTSVGPDDEVIVVDNGSTDHTRRVLDRHRDHVEVVPLAQNEGFAAGCNAGAAVASREVVVFLNNDTLPVGQWLDELLAPFARPGVGATGPMSNAVSGPQLLVEPAYDPQCVTDVRAREALVRESGAGEVVAVPRLVGFCLAVDRALLEGLGGFDTRFGIGGHEDDDLCTRILQRGRSLLMARSSFVHHIGHQTFAANGLDWLAIQSDNGAVRAAKLARMPPVSVLVLCGTDPDALIRTLVATVDTLPDVDAEVLLLAEDPEAVHPIFEQLSGRVALVEVSGLDEDASWERGLAEAEGSRRAMLRAGELPDAVALQALLTTRAEIATPAFIGATAVRTPLVSVIVPTYNRPELLDRALRSIASQTFRDVEVVVVNDAGVPVDGVIEAVRPRLDVRLIDHDRNRGRCGALNTALRAARGELLAFLDDDDVFYPDHLRTLVNALGEHRDRAVYSHAIKVVEDASGRVVHREVVGATDHDPEMIQITNHIVGMGVLCPREHVVAVGGYDEDLRVLEDWELWLKLSAVIPFRHVPVPTAEYRWRPGGGNQTVREWFRFHRALETVYNKHPLPPGSPLADARRSMLQGSAGRAEAHNYELSVVVLCEDDLGAAMRTVQAHLEEFGHDDKVELVLAVPDMSAWSSVVSGLSGDVQAFAVPPGDVRAAVGFLRERVGGRRIAHLPAGEGFDRSALAALTATTAGTAYVGRATSQVTHD